MESQNIVRPYSFPLNLHLHNRLTVCISPFSIRPDDEDATLQLYECLPLQCTALKGKSVLKLGNFVNLLRSHVKDIEKLSPVDLSINQDGTDIPKLGPGSGYSPSRRHSIGRVSHAHTFKIVIIVCNCAACRLILLHTECSRLTH